MIVCLLLLVGVGGVGTPPPNIGCWCAPRSAVCVGCGCGVVHWLSGVVCVGAGVLWGLLRAWVTLHGGCCVMGRQGV